MRWFTPLFIIKGKKADSTAEGVSIATGVLVVDGNFANQVTSLFSDLGPRSYKAGLFGILWWVGFPSGGPTGAYAKVRMGSGVF